MESLFKTELKYTFSEYKKFNKVVMEKKVKRVGIYLVLLALCGILLRILSSDTYISLFLLIFIIIYPIILYFSVKNKIKKTYDTNEVLKDLTQTIEFYEEYFFVKTENLEIRVEYNKIYKILETNTNFYLMIADNQGYIVLKENCSKELIDFLITLKNKSLERRK